MSDKIELIANALRYENLSSLEIAKRTGFSQPTVSRLLRKLPVIKLGGGRSTVFALTQSMEPIALREIDLHGNFIALGELYLQSGDRTLLVNNSSHISFDGLPFFLYDALPSGFLGAITLRGIVADDHLLNTKSDTWTDKQALHYLTHYGYDLPGDFVLGDSMAMKASELTPVTVDRIEYPLIASGINRTPDNAGSSVGGEQPKFTIFNGEHHLIVKYSPLISEENLVAIRHRDLMVCEYLALQALRNTGIRAAKSTLHYDDRIYLEIERFDREGKHGRRGMASLKMLDAEYVGQNTTWPAVSKALLLQGVIDKSSHAEVEVAYAFGRYIANTDMHLGNFSFYLDGVTPSDASPIYDMLPMAFMPKQAELVERDVSMPRFIDVAPESAQKAQEAALGFWQSVMVHPGISKDFKAQCSSLHNQLLELGTR